MSQQRSTLDDRLGVQVEITNSFHRLNQDRDGFLRCQELVGYLREFHLSSAPKVIGNYLYGASWNMNN